MLLVVARRLTTSDSDAGADECGDDEVGRDVVDHDRPGESPGIATGPLRCPCVPGGYATPVVIDFAKRGLRPGRRVVDGPVLSGLYAKMKSIWRASGLVREEGCDERHR